MKRWMWSAGLVAALGAAGCGVEYPKCDTSEDCERGRGEADGKLVCVNGLCQQCAADSDCDGAGMECSAGTCAEIIGYCERLSDCGDGQRCVESRCAAGCAADADCGEGQRCAGGRCEQAPECSADADCEGDSKCNAGSCEGPMSKGPCQLQRVYFAYDSAALPDGAREVLDANAACAVERGISLTIEGHSDALGESEYNLALSEVRARAAGDYLIRMGVPEERIESLGYGEEKPAKACEEPGTDACHAYNRRVEVLER